MSATIFRHTVRTALLLSSALISGLALGAGPSTQFSVTGTVVSPTSYTAATLAALPAITQTVGFSANGVPQAHTYTGASLWNVIDRAGIVIDPVPKNDVLNKVVVATGSDGYKVAFSLGELNPLFGNRPDLVAYSEQINGVATPLAADGFARITAPGDAKGGRYVSNLVNLDVRSSGSTQAGDGGGVSTQFTVGGAVASMRTFDLTALQALPVTTQVVAGISYTGVSFWDLLTSTVGIPVDPLVKNDILGKYVVATGSDGYKVAFSLGELSPDFGNQPDLIAYAVGGASLGSNGFARVVVPNDGRAGRWVSNLVSLEVFSAAPVPEPGSVDLMLAGLCMVVGARRLSVLHAERRR